MGDSQHVLFTAVNELHQVSSQGENMHKMWQYLTVNACCALNNGNSFVPILSDRGGFCRIFLVIWWLKCWLGYRCIFAWCDIHLERFRCCVHINPKVVWGWISKSDCSGCARLEALIFNAEPLLSIHCIHLCLLHSHSDWALWPSAKGCQEDKYGTPKARES